MTHPLLPWIVERSWFRRELGDGTFLFCTPTGRSTIGTFPELLVRAWVDENPGALGGGADPRETEGAESLAVQIDETLTLDRPGAVLGAFGLRRPPGALVEWFEEWIPTGELQGAYGTPESEPGILQWTAERPHGAEREG
jgi:hypothetical protein